MAVATTRRLTIDAAAAWLARLVDARGVVAYAFDSVRGPFLHGRSAAVIRALDAHGGHPQKVERARRWLRGEITRALKGDDVPDWPKESAGVAGTLALAKLAGIDVELEAFLAQHPVASPWHAAQCVAAIGCRAPAPLWHLCVRDLDREPWAPWTALAAQARENRAVFHRCAEALIRSIRTEAPYRGGANATAIPEIALTAITVQALALCPSNEAREARRRARQFIARCQMKSGAFPASPAVWYLRADITAHALLALLT